MKRPRRIRGIENRPRAGGRWTFRVRYTDPATGLRRSEEFDDQQVAIDFQAKLRLAKRGGSVADLTAGRELLRDFVPDIYWPRYALQHLARPTLKSYESVWRLHAEPRVGHLQLRQFDAGVAADLVGALTDDGVGAPTIVKTLAMLQSVFRRAVLWRRISVNPLATIEKPAIAAAAVHPLAPEVVERIAAQLPPAGRILVYLIAYAGLRPEEALALQWRHIRRSTILIEQKNVDGEIVAGQKVKGKPERAVRLLAPLAEDLAILRGSGSVVPLGTAYVLPRPSDGTPWRDTAYRKWRRTRWQPAAVEAGVATLTFHEDEHGGRHRSYDGPPPYWLRHSFASLLLHEGRLSVAEVADQLGHTIQTLLRYYAHIMADLQDQPKMSAEQQIRKARRTASRRSA